MDASFNPGGELASWLLRSNEQEPARVEHERKKEKFNLTLAPEEA